MPIFANSPQLFELISPLIRNINGGDNLPKLPRFGTFNHKNNQHSDSESDNEIVRPKPISEEPMRKSNSSTPLAPPII